MLIISTLLLAIAFLTQSVVLAAPIPLGNGVSINARLNNDAFVSRSPSDLATTNSNELKKGKPVIYLATTWPITDRFNHHICRHTRVPYVIWFIFLLCGVSNVPTLDHLMTEGVLIVWFSVWCPFWFWCTIIWIAGRRALQKCMFLAWFSILASLWNVLKLIAEAITAQVIYPSKWLISWASTWSITNHFNYHICRDRYVHLLGSVCNAFRFLMCYTLNSS